MRSALLSWHVCALLSAAFAALTAIFAKVGVENVNSDFATFVRTVVILCALGAILIGTGQWQAIGSVSARSYWFLVLSGLATGGSWVCYFRALKLGDAARVAPIDKLSVVLVAVFGVAFLGEKLSTFNWLGVAFIAAGAVLVAYKGLTPLSFWHAENEPGDPDHEGTPGATAKVDTEHEGLGRDPSFRSIGTCKCWHEDLRRSWLVAERFMCISRNSI